MYDNHSDKITNGSMEKVTATREITYLVHTHTVCPKQLFHSAETSLASQEQDNDWEKKIHKMYATERK